jgi:hypothetical protein
MHATVITTVLADQLPPTQISLSLSTTGQSVERYARDLYQ